jgi:glucose/mannose-6-phosphate isomerase
MTALTPHAVAAVDTTGQAEDIGDLAVHLRDALWRVESAAIAPIDAPGGLVVAGMGGSAVGGRLAAAAIGPRLARPMIVADDYALPGWAGPDTLVLCASYSGGTEETLSVYDDAVERDTQRLVATTGGELAERARRDGVPVIPMPSGFQPRAAIGYALVSALETAAACGAAPSLRSEIEAAAALAEDLAAEWGPEGAEDNEAKELARRLDGAVPVIAGAGAAAAAAYRWKCQVNENAGLPAFASAMPELCHNEVVGWPAAQSLGRFAAVFLDDSGAHPRNTLRTDLVAAQAAEWADVVERVAPRGESPLERLVSLVLLGDLVSLYLAVLRGKDPVAIAPIDALKAALAGR